MCSRTYLCIAEPVWQCNLWIVSVFFFFLLYKLCRSRSTQSSGGIFFTFSLIELCVWVCVNVCLHVCLHVCLCCVFKGDVLQGGLPCLDVDIFLLRAMMIHSKDCKTMLRALPKQVIIYHLKSKSYLTEEVCIALTNTSLHNEWFYKVHTAVFPLL